MSGSMRGRHGKQREAEVTEQGQAWGGPLWSAADLITPMAARVAATLRVADAITVGVTSGSVSPPVSLLRPIRLSECWIISVTAGFRDATRTGRTR